MTQHQKKQDERIYASILLHHLALSAESLIDPEEPDFLIEHDEGIVGIEITHVMRKSHNGVQPEHVQEAEQLQVVEIARQMHMDAYGQPLHVYIHFNSNRIDKTNRRLVAQWIARFAIDNQPETASTFEWDSADAEHGSYPACLAHISMYHIPSSNVHFWTSPRSGYLNAGLSDALEHALFSKEAKLPAYLRNCNMCWLLLIADGQRGVTLFEMDPTNPYELPRNGFDHVYFYERFSDKLTRLQ